MSLKHGLLGLLNYGPMTGYELSRVFQGSLDFFWQGQTSQIYRELNAMESCGYLASERVMQTDKPNKRVYSITDDGRRELIKWLSSPGADIDEAMKVKSAFLMRVFFAGELSDGQSIAMLKSFSEKCSDAIKSLNAANDAIENYGEAVGDMNKAKYWGLVKMFGEIFYTAELEWAKKAIAFLEGENK